MLKRPTGLLRLMGEAHIEQTARQEPEAEEATQVERIRRRNERRRMRHTERVAQRRVAAAETIISQHIDIWRAAGGSFDAYDPMNAIEWLTARRIARGDLPS